MALLVFSQSHNDFEIIKIQSSHSTNDLTMQRMRWRLLSMLIIRPLEAYKRNHPYNTIIASSLPTQFIADKCDFVP